MNNIHLHLGVLSDFGDWEFGWRFGDAAIYGGGRRMTLSEKMRIIAIFALISPLMIALAAVPKLGERVISMKQDFA